jgi:hypothetical protein
MAARPHSGMTTRTTIGYAGDITITFENTPKINRDALLNNSPDHATRKPRRRPYAVLAIVGLIGFAAAAFLLWPRPGQPPMSEKALRTVFASNKADLKALFDSVIRDRVTMLVYDKPDNAPEDSKERVLSSFPKDLPADKAVVYRDAMRRLGILLIERPSLDSKDVWFQMSRATPEVGYIFRGFVYLGAKPKHYESYLATNLDELARPNEDWDEFVELEKNWYLFQSFGKANSVMR